MCHGTGQETGDYDAMAEAAKQMRGEQDLVIVKIGEMRISTAQNTVLTTHPLGSCVGVAAYDPSIQLGGILHFMLPEPAANDGIGERRLLYGSLAIPMFFAALSEAGASTDRLIVKCAGGADVVRATHKFRIGEQNLVMARRMLEQNDIKVVGSGVGGTQARVIQLTICDGRCVVSGPLREEVEL